MAAGPTTHDEYAREDKQNEREYQLHGCFRRFLFSDLLPFDSHGFALYSQRLSDTRPKLIGLNEQRCQCPQIFDRRFWLPRSCRTAERARPICKCRVLQLQFVGENAIRVPHFIRYLFDALIQPQASFHAHDEQVQCIGKSESDLLLARRSHVVQHKLR